jgi:hypothetical protein
VKYLQSDGENHFLMLLYEESIGSGIAGDDLLYVKNVSLEFHTNL